MTSRDSITVLVLAVLLVVRVAGTHVHLCFDGQEPGASIHLVDAFDPMQFAAVEPAHDDTNIDLGSIGVAKLDLLALALIVSIVLWQAATRVGRRVPHRSLRVHASSIFHRVPPPRGPPYRSV